MPELPDVEVYCEAVAQRVVGQVLERVQLLNPFVLRTAVPPIDALNGRRVDDVGVSASASCSASTAIFISSSTS